MELKEKRLLIQKKELEVNIMRLEVSLLELDEKKELLIKNIEVQKQKLLDFDKQKEGE